MLHYNLVQCLIGTFNLSTKGIRGGQFLFNHARIIVIGRLHLTQSLLGWEKGLHYALAFEFTETDSSTLCGISQRLCLTKGAGREPQKEGQIGKVSFLFNY